MPLLRTIRQRLREVKCFSQTQFVVVLGRETESPSSSPPPSFPEASRILRRQHFLLNKLSGLCQACLCQTVKLQFQKTTGPGAHLCKVCAHESVFVARHHIEHESQVASWKYNNQIFLPLFMLSNPKLDEVPREFIILCFHSWSLCNLTSPQLLPRLHWFCTHSCARMPTHTYQIEIILSSSVLLITCTQRGSRQALGGVQIRSYAPWHVASRFTHTWDGYCNQCCVLLWSHSCWGAAGLLRCVVEGYSLLWFLEKEAALGCLHLAWLFYLTTVYWDCEVQTLDWTLGLVRETAMDSTQGTENLSQWCSR